MATYVAGTISSATLSEAHSAQPHAIELYAPK